MKIAIRIMILLLMTGFMSSGCLHVAKNDDTQSIVPEFVELSIVGDFPDYEGQDSLSPRMYQTYQWFDLSRFQGVGYVIDTPFVYLKYYSDKIIVRPSNDIENPYVLTRYGDYWHCKWMCDDRGDSLIVDRFVCNTFVYEFIQKLCSDGKVNLQLISYSPFFIIQRGSWSLYDVKKYALGSTDSLDYDAGEHLQEIRAMKDSLWCIIDQYSTSDTIKENLVESSTLKVNFGKDGEIPVFELSGGGRNVSYGKKAPMGFFDDRVDVERPYFIRRIK